MDNISKELQILIAAIKVVLLNEDQSIFEKIVKEKDLNWIKIEKMLIYHQIRPLFFEAAKRVNVQNSIIDRCEVFSIKQAIKNLNEKVESTRVLELLKMNNILALPYKGLLFLEKLYQNKPIREIGDLDILVKKEDGARALKCLIEDGYKLVIDNVCTDTLFDQIIETTPNLEIGLDKKTSLGLNVHIDFHWGLNESLNYNIDLNALFDTAKIDDFQGKKLLIPDSETIFKMLLNHHGGRECWVRLKDFSDLIAFKKTYPGMTDIYLLAIAETLKMNKISKAGLQLLYGYFIQENPEFKFTGSKKTLKQIVKIWEIAEHWDRVMPKIRLLKVYRKLQDLPTSWRKIIWQQIEFHSKANLTENKRFIVLPQKLMILNASSKLISYLLRRYFGIKIR